MGQKLHGGDRCSILCLDRYFVAVLEKRSGYGSVHRCEEFRKLIRIAILNGDWLAVQIDHEWLSQSAPTMKANDEAG